MKGLEKRYMQSIYYFTTNFFFFPNSHFCDYRLWKMTARIKLQSSLWQIGAQKVHVSYTRVKGWQIVTHKMQQGAGTGWTIYSPQVTRQVNRTQMELIRAAHTQSGDCRWLSSSFISAVLPRVFCLALLLLCFPLFQFYWQPRGFTCTLLPRLLSPCVTLCHFAVVSAASLFASPSLCRSLWICFCVFMGCTVDYLPLINLKPYVG